MILIIFFSNVFCLFYFLVGFGVRKERVGRGFTDACHVWPRYWSVCIHKSLRQIWPKNRTYRMSRDFIRNSTYYCICTKFHFVCSNANTYGSFPTGT